MYKSYAADYQTVLPPVRRLLFSCLGITSAMPRHFKHRLEQFDNDNKNEIGFIIHDSLFDRIESFLVTPGNKLREIPEIKENSMPVIVIPSENPYPSELKPSTFAIDARFSLSANKLKISDDADKDDEMSETVHATDNDGDNSDFDETNEDIQAAEPIIRDTKTDPEPVKVETNSQSKTILNTQAKPIRLSLTVPRFDPTRDSVDEACAKLKRLQPLVPNQTPNLILNFLQVNGLDNLLLSLTANELNNLEDFKRALARRYSRSNKATEFHSMAQAVNEPEIDFLNRLERAWKRLSSERTLTESDKVIIADKFISGLNDPHARLRIREQQPTYDKLADFASNIRQARLLEDTSTTALVERINQLSEGISKLSLTCKRCGLGHPTEECKANSKMKAQHNKRVKFQKERGFQPRDQGRHYELHRQRTSSTDTYPRRATDYGRQPSRSPWRQSDHYARSVSRSPPRQAYFSNQDSPGYRYGRPPVLQRPLPRNPQDHTTRQGQYPPAWRDTGTRFRGQRRPLARSPGPRNPRPFNFRGNRGRPSTFRGTPNVSNSGDRSRSTSRSGPSFRNQPQQTYVVVEDDYSYYQTM